MKQLLIPFVRAADDAALDKPTGNIGSSGNVLANTLKPSDLVAKLKLVLPEEGRGKDGLLQGIESILKYSVNTWDQGFLDKLFASNTPVRLCFPIPLTV